MRVLRRTSGRLAARRLNSAASAGSLPASARADVLGHVGFHVFLALEGVVELPHAEQRIRRLRLEHRHHQARLGLRDRHEQRARARSSRGSVLPGRPPPSGAGAPSNELAAKLALVGAEGLDVEPRPAPWPACGTRCRAASACPPPAPRTRPARGSRRAARSTLEVRHHLVAQRHVPDLRLGLVVARHQRAGHVGRRARVGVAVEVDRAASCRWPCSVSATGWPPSCAARASAACAAVQPLACRARPPGPAPR